MNKDLESLEWLIGQWEGIQDQGVYHEEWKKITVAEFKGKAYMIKKGEISNPEKLRLHADESGTYYIADVSHNPKPVAFIMTYGDGNTFVFENPEHDFPQKISYERKNKDELLATISATKGNKIKKVEFGLKRIKQ